MSFANRPKKEKPKQERPPGYWCIVDAALGKIAEGVEPTEEAAQVAADAAFNRIYGGAHE